MTGRAAKVRAPKPKRKREEDVTAREIGSKEFSAQIAGVSTEVTPVSGPAPPMLKPGMTPAATAQYPVEGVKVTGEVIGGSPLSGDVLIKTPTGEIVKQRGTEEQVAGIPELSKGPLFKKAPLSLFIGGGSSIQEFEERWSPFIKPPSEEFPEGAFTGSGEQYKSYLGEIEGLKGEEVPINLRGALMEGYSPEVLLGLGVKPGDIKAEEMRLRAERVLYPYEEKGGVVLEAALAGGVGQATLSAAGYTQAQIDAARERVPQYETWKERQAEIAAGGTGVTGLFPGIGAGREYLEEKEAPTYRPTIEEYAASHPEMNFGEALEHYQSIYGWVGKSKVEGGLPITSEEWMYENIPTAMQVETGFKVVPPPMSYEAFRGQFLEAVAGERPATGTEAWQKEMELMAARGYQETYGMTPFAQTRWQEVGRYGLNIPAFRAAYPEYTLSDLTKTEIATSIGSAALLALPLWGPKAIRVASRGKQVSIPEMIGQKYEPWAPGGTGLGGVQSTRLLELGTTPYRYGSFTWPGPGGPGPTPIITGVDLSKLGPMGAVMGPITEGPFWPGVRGVRGGYWPSRPLQVSGVSPTDINIPITGGGRGTGPKVLSLEDLEALWQRGPKGIEQGGMLWGLPPGGKGPLVEVPSPIVEQYLIQRLGPMGVPTTMGPPGAGVKLFPISIPGTVEWGWAETAPMLIPEYATVGEEQRIPGMSLFRSPGLVEEGLPLPKPIEVSVPESLGQRRLSPEAIPWPEPTPEPVPQELPALALPRAPAAVATAPYAPVPAPTPFIRVPAKVRMPIFPLWSPGFPGLGMGFARLGKPFGTLFGEKSWIFPELVISFPDPFGFGREEVQIAKRRKKRFGVKKLRRRIEPGSVIAKGIRV